MYTNMMTARKYWEMALAAAEPLEVDVEGQERVEVSVFTEEHVWQTVCAGINWQPQFLAQS